MYTYKVVNNGYEIYNNGRLFIRQVNCPIHGNESLGEVTSVNFAKLVIEKLNRGVSPLITEEEELELVSSDVTDARIIELANIWASK
jgi:hypothetical protein